MGRADAADFIRDFWKEIKRRSGDRPNPTLMVLEGAAAANPIRRRGGDWTDLALHPGEKLRIRAKMNQGRRRIVQRRRVRHRIVQRRTNPTVPGAALKMYRRFHGTDPMSVIKAPDQPGAPKYVVALGRLKDVSYQVPGHSKKAGRRNIPYKHISGRGNMLCTDASGRNLYIVKTRASRMRVRSNGIHD